jgi:hypothetical protein
MNDRSAVETDDEVEVLLRRERRRQGRERAGITIMVAGIVAGGLTVMLGDVDGVSEDWLSYGWATAAVLFVIGTVVVTLWKRGRATRRLNALIGRRDRLQRGRNDRIYATSITGWAMIAITLPALFRIAQGPATGGDIGFVVGATLSPWLVVLSVVGWSGLAQLNRRWLEDEVTRDIRRRALSFGFLVLMAALTGLFFLSLWRRDWGIMGFPAALMTASSATGLRFVWLDRQAEGQDLG